MFKENYLIKVCKLCIKEEQLELHHSRTTHHRELESFLIGTKPACPLLQRETSSLLCLAVHMSALCSFFLKDTISVFPGCGQLILATEGHQFYFPRLSTIQTSLTMQSEKKFSQFICSQTSKILGDLQRIISQEILKALRL